MKEELIWLSGGILFSAVDNGLLFLIFTFVLSRFCSSPKLYNRGTRTIFVQGTLFTTIAYFFTLYLIVSSHDGYFYSMTKYIQCITLKDFYMLFIQLFVAFSSIFGSKLLYQKRAQHKPTSQSEDTQH